MWNHQLKLGAIFLGIVVTSIIIHSQISGEKQLVVSEGVAIRQPASAPEKVILAPIMNTVDSDVYQFDRRMKAVINKKETLTDIHYAGYLFIDWKVVKSGERLGMFSFQVKGTNTSPVFVEVGLSNDYSLLSLKEPKISNEDEENALLFLKDLISIYSFKTFEDTTGKYSGTINMVSEDKTGRVWIKRKVKYSDATLAALKFNSSVHKFQVSEKLEEASGLEDAQMENELKTHSVYLLKRLSAAEVKSLGLKKNPIDSSTPLFAGSLKTNPNKLVAQKTSWDVLEKKLNTMSKLSAKERLGKFHELVKEMKSNPEKLPNFMEWMKAGMADQQKTSMGVGILATVGSAETQHELVQLFDQSKNNSPETAHLILNSLATSGNKLASEAATMLNSILENPKANPELTANAAYALGASGDIKKITELANQATSNSEKVVYIDALGNSGSVDALPYLLESAQSADPQIREKAVFALRFVNDQRVNSLFEQSMNDSSMGVRYSVVKAVPFQANPHEYETLLKNCSMQASDKNLKSLCTQALASL